MARSFEYIDAFSEKSSSDFIINNTEKSTIRNFNNSYDSYNFQSFKKLISENKIQKNSLSVKSIDHQLRI